MARRQAAQREGENDPLLMESGGTVLALKRVEQFRELVRPQAVGIRQHLLVADEQL